MNTKSIAVLMTCFNRREKTLDCLRQLSNQAVPYTVYLVDDGSSDGTAEAVRSEFPSVKVLTGTGNLFWCGGMRLAFATALESGHEYYAWLNDDTMLSEDALNRLVQTHKKLAAQGELNSIIVGSVRDPVTQQQTYGGRVKSQKLLSFKFEPVEPSSKPCQCDTFQGNIVLIHYTVAEKVGNVDAAFIHNFGDLDYGLRARQAGCSIWVAPGYIGECPQNSAQGSWVDMNLSSLQRIRRAFQVKNFPAGPWTIYLKRHAGLFWFVRWLLPYIRAAIGYRDLANSPTFSEGSFREQIAGKNRT
ncbi:MAG: glycosyltransferase family 2 protein [Cyanobacteria bacterium J06636_16]